MNWNQMTETFLQKGVVPIYGDIFREEAEKWRRLILIINASSIKEIKILIDSPGGSAMEGSSLITLKYQ